MNPDPGRPTTPNGPAQRKVFDVTRPGRAQPNSTSKPVIVGHRPVVSDPAVTMNGIGARPMMNPHKKISIMSHDDTPAPAAPDIAAPVPPTPAVPDAAPAKTPAAPALKPATPAPTPAPAAPAPTALTPALVAAATAADPVPKPSVLPWASPSAKPAVPAAPAAEAADPAEHAAAPAVPIDITADDAEPDDDLLAAMPAPAADEPHEAPTVS